MQKPLSAGRDISNIKMLIFLGAAKRISSILQKNEANENISAKVRVCQPIHENILQRMANSTPSRRAHRVRKQVSKRPNYGNLSK